MDHKFKTDIINLKSLEDFRFTIPTYQRPYVWGDEQLKKLLDNFYLSFRNNPNSIYYISSFLTKEDGALAELIDGQQRFTTLWIISFVLSRICPESDISNFLKKDSELRLSFEIRKEVTEFLTSLLEEDNSYRKIQNKELIIEQPYLKNIAHAVVFIKGYVEQTIPKNELLSFGNFIYENVHLIKNTTPPKTDLNKLFSTINSAGIQLEQTDIVKANLLNLIDEKVMFGKIWETCENMSNFFERNARVSFPESNWKIINLNNHLSFDPTVFKYVSNNSEGVSLSELFRIDDLEVANIGQYEFPDKIYENEKDRKSEEIYCRSIINFGQFLLHTYRLHLHRENINDFEGTFHVSRLIEVFKEMEDRNDPEEIKRFFLLLWDVRYLFDKYIIKWISDADTKVEHLELMNFNRNEESYYSRSRYEKSDSLMLQSILYFTGDYLRQYWITTYLGYLLENHSDLAANNSIHLKCLERFDNLFSVVNSQTDKELSWNLLDPKYTSPADIDIKEYLNESRGTVFKHYWFQKLEYILWKNWEFEENDQYRNYRITSKNSIEHIYPQNPENRNQHPEIEFKSLHSFGNLVLLSVSQNSEYSNKSVNVKKSMFQEKRDTYDALKSYYIFSKDSWNEKEIESHKDEMINKLLDHYSNDK
ncbi:DUF262 domain-containing protein [Cyclobacterium jeungdonense]|uniref:DUF262 domain-containing HNH endonuclease family protein n=1 Tax=Cyclobacterium jeungdonense TaxID=708087 RepID=A0ABT8CAQ5_9BACT|nr:DUF262 domain-containing protein [Cyclobacterium jeungdonense]MDN3689054.1 DUF262 domain-containing HNH endonuclease family protein [Cyclobacterium jeungdonense]